MRELAEQVQILSEEVQRLREAQEFDRKLLEARTAETAPRSGASISSDRFEAVESFDGNAEAVLTGDRGNIMKCRFHITDIIFGFTSGGFGICQVSDGREIDIYF